MPYNHPIRSPDLWHAQHVVTSALALIWKKTKIANQFENPIVIANKVELLPKKSGELEEVLVQMRQQMLFVTQNFIFFKCLE